MSSISTLIIALTSDFFITDLGPLHYFLSAKVANGLILTQQIYIFYLLTWKYMQLAKPMKTPMAISKKINAFIGPIFDNPTLYQSTTGSLQYLSFIRLDLAYVVGKVC